LVSVNVPLSDAVASSEKDSLPDHDSVPVTDCDAVGSTVGVRVGEGVRVFVPLRVSEMVIVDVMVASRDAVGVGRVTESVVLDERLAVISFESEKVGADTVSSAVKEGVGVGSGDGVRLTVSVGGGESDRVMVTVTVWLSVDSSEFDMEPDLVRCVAASTGTAHNAVQHTIAAKKNVMCIVGKPVNLGATAKEGDLEATARIQGAMVIIARGTPVRQW
jgi:hypothetical protein